MVVYQELTLTNWAPGTTFQALAFEKHTKCENLASCLNALESALNDIGNLDLKKNTNNTSLIKQYFYLQTWKKLMVDNKYLKMTLKNNQIRNEIAVAEDLAEVNNDTLRHANSNYEGADNQESQSTYNDELDERNFVFSMLKSGEKWYLSNGKYVDDELFIFGLQCESGHPTKKSYKKSSIIRRKASLQLQIR
ncbi:hypothetical protein BDF21DRAFT_468713 [Thamnidium elegans]|nr:hypothetical protein BDF21DRAFT_468713 [Thamnidium elegans]